MNEFVEKLKFNRGTKFSLKNFDTSFDANLKKEDTESMLSDLIKQTSELQTKLYTSNSRALLILFQGIDASGKDSAIAHSLSGLNPQGCEVFSFKQPNNEEMNHDFLWRHYKAFPQFGRIGVHNRSYYENVLITKVHPALLKNEYLPSLKNDSKINKEFWENRYKSIRNVEEHLIVNGTVIIKFFLHLSKDEQKERFLKRINEPEKNWKFSAADINERRYWNQYMQAYEMAIKNTATENSPWYIIPADKKWFTRFAVSTIILETLKSLNLEFPILTHEEMAKFEKAKNNLLNKF
jgi:PPK2 family polyphosphate:nucleotide phosphotransferase